MLTPILISYMILEKTLNLGLSSSSKKIITYIIKITHFTTYLNIKYDCVCYILKNKYIHKKVSFSPSCYLYFQIPYRARHLGRTMNFYEIHVVRLDLLKGKCVCQEEELCEI